MGPVRAPVGKGDVSPIRTVPSSIPRPEYVGKRRAAPWRGGDVHGPETIERIRAAGRLAAQALAAVCDAVKPGVTTDELDRIGHEFLVDHGAYPSTLGYPGAAGKPPFPKSLCTSLNEVICHGIPDSTVVQDGRHRQDRHHGVQGRRPRGQLRERHRRRGLRRGARTWSTRRGRRSREASRPSSRAARSTSSAGSSRRTRRGTDSNPSATTPATGSARRSIPAW